MDSFRLIIKSLTLSAAPRGVYSPVRAAVSAGGSVKGAVLRSGARALNATVRHSSAPERVWILECRRDDNKNNDLLIYNKIFFMCCSLFLLPVAPS